MNKKSLLVTILVIIAISVVILYFYFRNDRTAEPSWKTANVEKGNISLVVSATGTVNADTTIQIGAQVSGIVSKILVDFTSPVKKGQVIALLDTTLLYAAFLDAKATTEKVRTQLELQSKNFARSDTLFREKVIARTEYEQAYASYHSAQSDLQSALANLNHARINLRYATITSPITGTVISRNVDVGQTVISSFNAPTLFAIANDLKKMQVLANVDEADIGQVKIGQTAVFTVDAYPNDKFSGTVNLIRLQPVTIQNVVNYIVVIDVDNSELKLMPGLTANITIDIEEHSNVLRVPGNAIHFMPGPDYLEGLNLPDSLIAKIKATAIAGNEMPVPGATCWLWVLKDNAMIPVMATAGLYDGSYLEVAGNINAGETVVVGMNNEKAQAATSKNPFMPQMRAPRKK